MNDRADQVTTSNTGAVLPTAVARLASAVADFIGVTVDDLFIGDHTHEGLSKGSYSFAYEGDHDWAYRFTYAAYDTCRVRVPMGWAVDAGAGWFLIVYPETY